MATTTLSNEEILEAIGHKTVLELADLIDAFKSKFNVTVAAGPAGAGAGVPHLRTRTQSCGGALPHRLRPGTTEAEPYFSETNATLQALGSSRICRAP